MPLNYPQILAINKIIYSPELGLFSLGDEYVNYLVMIPIFLPPTPVAWISIIYLRPSLACSLQGTDFCD